MIIDHCHIDESNKHPVWAGLFVPPPPFPFPVSLKPWTLPGGYLALTDASCPGCHPSAAIRRPHQSPEEHAARPATRKAPFRVALSSRLRSRQRGRLATARHRGRRLGCRLCMCLASDFHLGCCIRLFHLTVLCTLRRRIRAWPGPAPFAAGTGPARKQDWPRIKGPFIRCACS